VTDLTLRNGRGAVGGGSSAAVDSRAATWRTSVVREVAKPTRRAVILRLEVPDRITHVPGQHYIVRLTAEDGYTASRSYSVASAPGDPLVELYVERLDEGEVSTYLADVVEPGDELEVRGPIGGWFVWDGSQPALGIGGGSGVVPLVAMLRHARDLGRTELLRLAMSARTRADLPYERELSSCGALVALTREPNGTRPAMRLTSEELGPLIASGRTAYVCGSASFAEAMSTMLVDLGMDPAMVRVERFGPSG
jgi:ferredoxin-NADP reductase